jgi:uncharacterized membrane protein SirB2
MILALMVILGKNRGIIAANPANENGKMTTYPALLHAHFSLAVLSASVFVVRGLLVLGGSGSRANANAVRYASYGIDSLLLAAAIALLVLLRGAPLHATWLQLKLLLLVVYVVLGTLALRRARGRVLRACCYFGALAALGAIFRLALTR